MTLSTCALVTRPTQASPAGGSKTTLFLHTLYAETLIFMLSSCPDLWSLSGYVTRPVLDLKSVSSCHESRTVILRSAAVTD